MKNRISTTLLLLVWCYALPAQNIFRRSGCEVNMGIGKRAYIDSRKGVWRGTGTFTYNWNIHPLWDIRTGLEVTYWDRTYRGRYNDAGYLLRASSYENFASAFFLGGDFKMNHLIFQFGYGKYIDHKGIKPFPVMGYSKFGFRYCLSQHWNIGFYVRIHRNEADYLDFGFGYKF